MAIIAQSFSNHEWQAYILKETDVGTAVVTSMIPLNVDKPISITENPFLVQDVRSRLGTGAGSGRTMKKADWLAEPKGQIRTISFSGIADTATFPVLAENVIGIAEAAGFIAVPYNYGANATGSQQGFLTTKTGATTNEFSLTFALVNPITAKVLIYPGCICNELSWEDNVANEGGRRTFSATLISRVPKSVDQADLTTPATMSTSYYSIWDYSGATGVIKFDGADVVLARLSITINGNTTIKGVGLNGEGDTVNKGIPTIGITGEVDIKWASDTDDIHKKYSASSDVIINITDNDTIASAATGFEATYCRLNSDVNLIDADGEAYITVPFTVVAGVAADDSGIMARIPV